MNGAAKKRYAEPLEIGGERLLPGEARTVEINVAPHIQ